MIENDKSVDNRGLYPHYIFSSSHLTCYFPKSFYSLKEMCKYDTGYTNRREAIPVFLPVELPPSLSGGYDAGKWAMKKDDV